MCFLIHCSASSPTCGTCHLSQNFLSSLEVKRLFHHLVALQADLSFTPVNLLGLTLWASRIHSMNLQQYAMLACMVLTVMSVITLLHRMDGTAFNGKLPKPPEPPPIAYPRWMLILSNYQLSNPACWTLWILLLGHVTHCVAANPYQAKSSCWTICHPQRNIWKCESCTHISIETSVPITTAIRHWRQSWKRDVCHNMFPTPCLFGTIVNIKS
jgi:hypothetical protein